jgi:hypothetical protein
VPAVRRQLDHVWAAFEFGGYQGRPGVCRGGWVPVANALLSMAAPPRQLDLNMSLADQLRPACRTEDLRALYGHVVRRLLVTEEIGAPEVHCRPVAQATIADPLLRCHGTPPLSLARLAERAGRRIGGLAVAQFGATSRQPVNPC